MSKFLGIDTGTNSLGWAIVDSHEDGGYSLLEYGTNIFQEGVKIEKGIESSKASERTEHRSLRKHYWRRRVRKIRLLAILIDYHLCPPLHRGLLRTWRLKKMYPTDEAFMAWQRTDDDHNINPYFFRYKCLTTKLDMTDLTQRYILGRALYHLNQRRGFLSNRKESTKESEGAVKQGISDLSAEISAAGCKYLGEYFYLLYQEGKKIRSHYTARNEHYLAEFKAICEKQELPNDLVEKLEKAIFYQRPLKSQKQQVGHCTFEPRKPRCSASHPVYEEFRMLSFINNIRVTTYTDSTERPLTDEEKAKIYPVFLNKIRKSKPTFAFEEIAKKLAGKNNYCHKADKAEKPYRFNYHMDQTVSGCSVTAQLMDIFGEDWRSAVCELYTLAGSKSQQAIINDVWHALFFYDDEDKLAEFAHNRLQLSEEEALRFAKIKLPQEYASLSLNALNKILPYLKDYGLRYDEAVLLANLGEVVPAHLWGLKKVRLSIIDALIALMAEEVPMTKEQRIKDFLAERYGVDDDHLKKLYHPSMMDLYPRQRPTDKGYYQLGSPRISSVRNPMAMHSLFRLRKVVNTLLQEGKIDEDTTIHIEFSRDLNDANRRKAIQSYQKNNEDERKECRKRIKELYDEAGIEREPKDVDILKYQLWEEQNHCCIYTGEEISLTDFLGANPKYDIEHTVPRSVGGDTTKMNLTLCQSRFNREVKGARLPSQLSNHNEILERIAEWKQRYEELASQIRKLKGVHPADKDSKDRIIRKRHLLSIECDYWRGKYERFTMTEVPEGFSRRQGTDISVISRYARLYLKSVFRHVYIVKGIATSDFRKIWGIQDEYEKKERVNHTHHCIDAVTIACIGPNEYGQLAHYYHQLEDHEKHNGNKPHFPLPWGTFVEDMKRLPDSLLIAHHTQDNMPKSARRRILTSQGKVLTKGDVARGSLHQDTYYGAIMRDDEVKYVVRKALAALDEKSIKDIVDDEVRRKVEEAVHRNGSLKKAVEADDVWMNKEKGVRIGKVRVFTGSVTRPINLRKQRDVSRHEHKQQYHVQNDRNYMMGIYVGQDEKGREKREFRIVSNLEAASYYRRSRTSAEKSGAVLPSTSAKGYPLKYELKIGRMVLLYENNPEEIWQCSKQEMQRRLYKVTGFSSFKGGDLLYGRVSLVHHQEARPSTEVKLKNGTYCVNEELRPGIVLLHTQFRALVEGQEFTLNELGEIQRIE